MSVADDRARAYACQQPAIIGNINLSEPDSMDDWSAITSMFKESPLTAIGMVIFGGGWWIFKSIGEKRGDNREVERLTTALSEERDMRSKAETSRDEAIEKQIQQVERFSEMRAQNERLLERMDSLGDHVNKVVEENIKLREQVTKLTEQVGQLTAQNEQLSGQVKTLQSTLNASTRI